MGPQHPTSAPASTSANPTPVPGEALEEALASGSQPPVGRYRLDLRTGHWQWSDEIYIMHGFAPGEIVPTTELMLSHKHPEDRARADGVLKEAAETGGPFSSVHRIFDASGKQRKLAIIGQGRTDHETGATTELYGYFIDVTDADHEMAQREATASIQAAAENRAAIEQAKGILMAGLKLDPQAVFDELRTASNHANVPVRDLATWLVQRFTDPATNQFPSAEQLTAFLAAPAASTSLDPDASEAAPLG